MFAPVIWPREELGIALHVIPHPTSPIFDFTTLELPKQSMNAFMAPNHFPCFKFQDWMNEMEISKPTCLPRQSIRMLKNHSASIPSPDNPQQTDLGIWNIFWNPDFPGSQLSIWSTLCEDALK